jgi:Phosphotransferase enzyme family
VIAMLDDRTAAAAAAAIGAESLTGVARLNGNDRTEVWRVTDGAASYVVKAYRTRDEGSFAREPAALGALGAAGTAGFAPRLLGVGTDPDLVVLEDLGCHPHVADRLLGRDPAAAAAAVEGWADAMAGLHLATTDAVLDDYGRRLGARAPDVETHQIPQSLSYSADRLVALGEVVDLPPDLEFLDTFRDLAATFSEPAPVLTAGDACPDNNLLRGDGVALIDFEFAEVRHLTWDVAYLRVPWPTCWCSWRLPTRVAEAAVARYRARVAPTVPYVGTPAFLADLDLATLGWCLMTVTWWVDGALEEDVTPVPEGPSSRPRLLHRLWMASHLPGPPALSAYARDLYRVLVRRWGEPTLVVAPAFREDDILIP